MKTIAFVSTVIVSTLSFAATSIDGAQLSKKFASVLGGNKTVQGQLMDGSACSVSLEIGAGRSTGIDTVTVKSGRIPVPTQIAHGAKFKVSLKKSKEGYVTETYSNSFGGSNQQLSLTEIHSGLFIARAIWSMNGSSVDTADCLVNLEQ